ncbi:hypothetical protein [Pseudopedobacter beijingensis]|uniref:Uncharacterized protein n=1 Tax=Pseudopedobacter beijingensis TaxID=1207056 RepID=A0ABW4I9X5_9SPHI
MKYRHFGRSLGFLKEHLSHPLEDLNEWGKEIKVENLPELRAR